MSDAEEEEWKVSSRTYNVPSKVSQQAVYHMLEVQVARVRRLLEAISWPLLFVSLPAMYRVLQHCAAIALVPGKGLYGSCYTHMSLKGVCFMLSRKNSNVLCC